MFKELTHLIDKWNMMVESDAQVGLVYSSAGWAISEPNKLLSITDDSVESLYSDFVKKYTDRFADPAIEPERFKITEIEPIVKCENHFADELKIGDISQLGTQNPNKAETAEFELTLKINSANSLMDSIECSINNQIKILKGLRLTLNDI